MCQELTKVIPDPSLRLTERCISYRISLFIEQRVSFSIIHMITRSRISWVVDRLLVQE